MLRNKILLPAIIAACMVSISLATSWARAEILDASASQASPDAPPNPELVRLPFSFLPREFECAPVIYQGRPLIALNRLYDDPAKTGVYFRDLITGQEYDNIAEQFALSSSFAEGDEINLFSTELPAGDWTGNIYRFSSTDMTTWTRELAIARDSDAYLFNTSVCRDDQGYVMAYESNKPVQWSFQFARSNDLSNWEKIEGLEFADVGGGSCCANPVIRYCAPYYYAIYGGWSWTGPGKYYDYHQSETKYITMIARSTDLATWDVSPTRSPMLDPVLGEGINNTDADLFEYEGNTYVYYVTGDQSGTWGTTRVAMYAGPMQEMLEAYFPADVPTIKFDAAQRKYIYPTPPPPTGTVIYDHFDDPATVGDGINGTLWYVGGADQGVNVPSMSNSILNIDNITAAAGISSKTQYGPGTAVAFRLDDIGTDGKALGLALTQSALFRNDQEGGLWQFVVDNGVDEVFRSGDLFAEGSPNPGSVYSIAWYDNCTILWEDGVLLAYAPIAMTDASEIFAYSDGHLGLDYVAVGAAPTMLPGDADFSQTVDEADAAILAANWGTQGTATWIDGDFNGDGNVDDIDASLLAANWQKTNMPPDTVPEPSMLTLIVFMLSGVASLRVEKKQRSIY